MAFYDDALRKFHWKLIQLKLVTEKDTRAI